MLIGFDPENLGGRAVGSWEGEAGIALGSIIGSAMVAIRDPRGGEGAKVIDWFLNAQMLRLVVIIDPDVYPAVQERKGIRTQCLDSKEVPV
ncbi:MAG: hypothetical protein EWM72_00689 [Nitrospira sp.]|nr:MAG: hypothetical protein EWM72_00689 [Nitrospira sp.]